MMSCDLVHLNIPYSIQEKLQIERSSAEKLTSELEVYVVVFVHCVGLASYLCTILCRKCDKFYLHNDNRHFLRKYIACVSYLIKNLIAFCCISGHNNVFSWFMYCGLYSL